MTKLKVLAAVALVMAYIAGIATGWAGSTLAGEKPGPARDRGSWLSHALELSDSQKAQLEAIWSREAENAAEEDSRARVRALYEERNQAVREMLTPEQQAAYDGIHQSVEEQKDAIAAERRARHEAAVSKTMDILTPEQQEKYKKIIEDFEKRSPRRDRGPGGWNSGGK
ncbi:MAG: Spy/CpxP family protein refolding chaperone [Candidatus Hydrogenedentes bacterium]|nr:Spy/CpxP family protein refolding chaperone [Candidatus Hydrogenedentota bacterium]